MFTVVYKAAKFHSFTEQIVHIVSAYGTQLSTNLEKKQRGCSVTRQFSLPNFPTFLGFVATSNSDIWESSTGTAVCHSRGPCVAAWWPPWLNTLSTAALDAGAFNALSAGRYSLLSDACVWLCYQNALYVTRKSTFVFTGYISRTDATSAAIR